MLSQLANNGGATQALALLPGSQAIDAGNSDQGLTLDQNGSSRAAGAAADIGVLEPAAETPNNEILIGMAQTDTIDGRGGSDTIAGLDHDDTSLAVPVPIPF